MDLAVNKTLTVPDLLKLSLKEYEGGDGGMEKVA